MEKKTKKLYDVWYKTVTERSIVKHYIAHYLTFKKAHEIKRAHPYKTFVKVTPSGGERQ
jgi:hypothetical protein